MEVLRGPQGALYGRNSLGGAINMISKKPEDAFDLEVTGRAGENDLLGAEAILNLPLNDAFAARLGLAKEEQDDGFYEDINGDAVDRSKHEHVRASLRARPSENLDATYSFDWADEVLPIGIQARREGSVLELTGGDPFKTTINDRHESLNEVMNQNLLVDFRVPGGTISSVTNYRDRDVVRFDDFDQSFAAAPAATVNVRVYQEVESEIFFQELRFVSGGAEGLTYLLGADYYTTDTSELIDFFHLGGNVNPNSLIRLVDLEVDSWAVFGSVGYAFQRIPLELTFELRYAEDEVTGATLEQFPLQPNFTPELVSNSDTYENLPWSITAAWHFDQPAIQLMDDGMVYAKSASAYRHGGTNLYGGLPTDRYPVVPLYDEESSITYEIGFKTSWFGNQINFNGAAFLQQFDDFMNTTTNGCPQLCTYFHPVSNEPLGFDASGNPIITTPEGLPGNESQTFFFIDNVGEVETWGVELELAWQTIIDATGGRLSGNLGWARQLGEVESIKEDVSPAVLGLEGARQNMLREHQVKGNLIYRQPIGFLGSAIEFMIATTYVYETGGIWDLETAFPLDTVERLDTRVGLEGETWSFMVTGTNVLDKEFEIFGDATRYIVNDPRYVYAEFTWRGFGR